MKIVAKISDPIQMRAADALFPVYPFQQNLTGYMFDPSSSAQNRTFKINVSAGRGIVATERFIAAYEDQDSISWVERRYTNPLKFRATNTNGPDRTIDIIGFVKITFWLPGKEHGEYVEWSAVAMVTESAGCLCGLQMWIGSNTARIMPNPRNVEGFICKGDDGNSCEIRGSI